MKYPFIIIGLTGSIGMGKSETARMFKRLGVPVHDADAAVHQLFIRGGKAVGPVDDAFPGVVVDGAIDRQKLGQAVFGDKPALKRLEAIVHPLVGESKERFMLKAALDRVPVVALDVPLLFETDGHKRCDFTVVVSAPERMQTRRVLARPGMTAEKLASIRAAQMPDGEKRRRADFVVPTGLGKAFAFAKVKQIVQQAKAMRPSPQRKN